MDLGPLRALAFGLSLSAHGVDVTVTRPAPDDEPIATRGIWLTPVTDSFPVGASFHQSEPVRIMALSRAIVEEVPRGTVVLAPEKSGDVVQRWRVDATDRQEADHTRVIVVAAPLLEP